MDGRTRTTHTHISENSISASFTQFTPEMMRQKVGASEA